jgi:hypothetical protein
LRLLPLARRPKRGLPELPGAGPELLRVLPRRVISNRSPVDACSTKDERRPRASVIEIVLMDAVPPIQQALTTCSSAVPTPSRTSGRNRTVQAPRAPPTPRTLSRPS